MTSLVLYMRFSVFALILPFLGVFQAVAQRGQAPQSRTGSSIIDDTTRNIYGPKTSLWTTEAELFNNRPNYRPLDTAINNYHRWTYVQAFNNFYKDLGVMGTALSPIFPTLPTMIGATSGFQVYEPYYGTEEPKYFDTKSPYTRMFVVWGGNGRAATRVEFSRNINPRWNIGFNYRPILVDKQQQRQKGVRQTISHYYDFYTTYKTKNERYKLLFNFRRIRHKVLENGGVALKPEDPPVKLFDENAAPILKSAKSEEFRRNYHLFHQYQLAKALQIYHIADLTEHENVFVDYPGTEPPGYFDHNEISADTTFDKTTFSTTQQEFGIKGTARKFFYSAYYKIRTYKYGNRYLEGIEMPVATSGVENYLGGRLSLKLDSVSEFAGSAEYLLNGYYRIEGQIQTPWIEGFFRNSLSKPGFMQMVYRGGHDYWNQSFTGINSTQAQGFLKLNTGSLDLRAGATFTLLSNSVYFKQVVPTDTVNTQTVLPFQSSGIQSTFSPEVRMSLRFFRHMFFRPQVVYTTFIRNDDNVLKIPELFFNGQLTYENLLFDNHLQLQTGVDFHWRSTYQALGYDPMIQQFYVQEPLVNAAFPLVDVFLSAKMGRGRFFVKYTNLVQTFTKSGYEPTPGYPGQNPQIDFGFDFLLFD